MVRVPIKQSAARSIISDWNTILRAASYFQQSREDTDVLFRLFTLFGAAELAGIARTEKRRAKVR